MPAPKSILRTERKPFAPVDVAVVLYKKTLDACLKMPKRYTYLVLQDVIHLAGSVMDNASGANSIRVVSEYDAELRRSYWIAAQASLEGLAVRIDRFLEIPETLRYVDEKSGREKGITISELETIADLIIRERELLKGVLLSEQQRFKDL